MLKSLIALVPALIERLHKTTGGGDPTAHPAYLAAVGLAGYAAYLFSLGDLPGAAMAGLQALAAAGVTHAALGETKQPPPPKVPG